MVAATPSFDSGQISRRVKRRDAASAVIATLLENTGRRASIAME